MYDYSIILYFYPNTMVCKRSRLFQDHCLTTGGIIGGDVQDRMGIMQDKIGSNVQDRVNTMQSKDSLWQSKRRENKMNAEK